MHFILYSLLFIVALHTHASAEPSTSEETTLFEDFTVPGTQGSQTDDAVVPAGPTPYEPYEPRIIYPDAGDAVVPGDHSFINKTGTDDAVVPDNGNENRRN